MFESGNAHSKGHGLPLFWDFRSFRCSADEDSVLLVHYLGFIDTWIWEHYMAWINWSNVMLQKNVIHLVICNDALSRDSAINGIWQFVFTDHQTKHLGEPNEEESCSINPRRTCTHNWDDSVRSIVPTVRSIVPTTVTSLIYIFLMRFVNQVHEECNILYI